MRRWIPIPEEGNTYENLILNIGKTVNPDLISTLLGLDSFLPDFTPVSLTNVEAPK